MFDVRDALRLYAVTDRSWVGEGLLGDQVRQAIEGGVTMVQLREKEMPGAAFLIEAKEIKAVCDQFGVPLIINDSAEIAQAVDAAGVHLGQKDTDIEKARSVLGPGKIIGVTAKSVGLAVKAERQGADYLGVGDVFGTKTKKDAKRISRQTLTDICRAVDTPVVAIGGITEGNAEELSGTGIAGIAVVSAIFAQQDIRSAAAKLRMISEEL